MSSTWENGGAVGGEGLHEDLPGDLAPAGASRDLDEELEGAFGSAEVGKVEGQVGIEHADERDVGEVEAFGDHLSADEDVELLGTELAQGVAQLVLALHGVGVHAGDAGLGEDLANDGLHPLGAEAGELDAGVIASRALGRREAAGSANVADETIVRLVQGHGDAAFLALHHLATRGAGEGGMKAAAVDEKDDLLALFQTIGDGVAEFLGKAGSVLHFDASAFAPRQSQVHDANQRQAFAIGAALHAQQFVLAPAGVFI